jgi:hypothetical protein
LYFAVFRNISKMIKNFGASARRMHYYSSATAVVSVGPH